MGLTACVKNNVQIAARLAVLVALGLVVREQLLSLDIDALTSALACVGWMVVVVLIPAALFTIADTLGWAACIPPNARDVTLRVLVSIRLSCDALCNSLPGGVAAGEGLRSVLLRDRCEIDITESTASCLLARVNMAIAHMMFLCMVGVPISLGIEVLVRSNLLPGGTIAAIAATVAAGLLLAGLFFLFDGLKLSSALRTAARIPVGCLQRAVEKITPHVARLDARVGSFAHEHPARFRRSLAFFFFGWLSLGAESFIILLLLGADITLLEGLAIEAVVSVLRIVFFFLPSAVGAAEMAYISILTALGISDPLTVSAVFIAIKRSREALWILMGYAVLAKVWPLRRPEKREARLSGSSCSCR